MQASNPRTVAIIALALVLVVSAHADANRIQIGGVTLEFNAPANVSAYEHLPVDIKLTGKGDVTVQAVATDDPAYERFFDSAIPNRIAFSMEYLREEGNNSTFRLTNIGDTIWKASGYGKMRPAHFSHHHTDLYMDVPPGQSVTKTFPVSRMRATGGNPGDRRFVLRINRDNPLRRQAGSGQIELIVPDCKPGHVEFKRVDYGAVPVIDDFKELGHSYIRRELSGGSTSGRLKVQAPPWADRLVVRLINGGAMRTVSVPLNVSHDTLKLGGNPNTRWTLNGKPIFIAENIRADEVGEVREKFGGDNVVLAYDTILNSSRQWREAVREHGFKIMPVSIAYVRLQYIGDWSGHELMQGAPEEQGIRRVDAMDPNFHIAMADVIDKFLEENGDIVYRTADGKIPITLSEEQSYGFPYPGPRPTRWGGGTPENVAAFRVWLEEKYGGIGKLNERWGTDYGSFEEIDPSPLARLTTPDYPDPWKEWGPAINDFDIFRSKLHGEFWARTVEEVKRRHPDVILGMNFFGGYASDTEPLYAGFYEWGVTDHEGNNINWMGRRTGSLPKHFEFLDFVLCWNTGSADGAKKQIEFWRERGIETVIFAREQPRVFRGEELGVSNHSWFELNRNLQPLGGLQSMFMKLKTTYEHGGIAGLLNDPFIGTRYNEVQRREFELFNKAVAEAASRQ